MLRSKAIRQHKSVVDPNPGQLNWLITAGRHIVANSSSFLWLRNYEFETHTTVESVRGVWAVIIGLSLAILLLIGGNWNRLKDVRASLDKVFSLISESVLDLGGGNPLVTVATSVGLLSAMTGSASGGMSIALDTLGPTLVDLANVAGVSLEAMHRVTAVASGSLDALPHNGAVITLLTVCNLSHRDSYLDIFVTAIITPLIALIVMIALASFLGTF